MKIKWNSVTWYSWTLTAIIFLVVVPALAYYFVIEFKAISALAPQNSSVVSGTVDVHKNIPCQSSTDVDTASTTYPIVKCNFTKITTGDSFVADIGHNQKAIFTYVGESSPDFSVKNQRVRFDMEQENAWTYQIVGHEVNPPRSLTIAIGDYRDIVGFSLMDLNFDGYFEILSAEQYPASANIWKNIIWFDADNQEYKIPNASDDENTLNSFDPDGLFDLKNKTISTSGTAGWASSYNIKYSFMEGKWVLVEVNNYKPDDSGKYCVTETKKLIKGKYVETKTSQPRDPDEHC